MRFQQQDYQQYVKFLQDRLFDGLSFDEILKGVPNSHRKRRFAYLYLVQSKEIYDYYYERRNELGIQNLFHTIVATLLRQQQNQRFLECDMVKMLGIHRGMLTSPNQTFSVREMAKDLNSYVWHTKKETMFHHKESTLLNEE